MTGFSPDWLALREPFDTAARAQAWPALDLSTWATDLRVAKARGNACAVVDLACGSGANLRALAPRIGGTQHWRLLDHDPALLAALPQAMAEWAGQNNYRFSAPQNDTHALRIEGPDFHAHVIRERIDLARDLDSLDFTQTDLVTGSALLDLVSAQWLQTLLQRASGTGTALLFALSVDGRTAWHPNETDDETVNALFAQHQLGDKGFGSALGPRAVAEACRQLAAAGYAVRQAASDWHIDGAQDAAMFTAMVEGVAGAACEHAPHQCNLVQAWKARRLASMAHGRLVVGHTELMAVPARASGPGPTTGPAPSALR